MSIVTYNVTEKFPFDQLSLENPHGVQGGAYFSKIRVNGNPFLFQTPKCSTKAAIVRTEKKIYCDLILTNENDTFIQFLQELEKEIQTLIYEKRNIWFHNDMEMENIEYFFNPVVRTYKKNFLVRTYIQQPKHIKSTKSLQIYDENENRLTIQDIKKNNKIIAILEGLGIKFTSSSFHLELCLRQAMVLEDKPIFQKCLIQMQKPVGNEKITLAPKKNENSLPDTQVNIAKPQDNDNTDEELEEHVETDNEDKNSVGSNIESVKEDITDVATDAITENVVSKDDKCNIIKTTNIPESDTLIPNKEKHLDMLKISKPKLLRNFFHFCLWNKLSIKTFNYFFLNYYSHLKKSVYKDNFNNVIFPFLGKEFYFSFFGNVGFIENQICFIFYIN